MSGAIRGNTFRRSFSNIRANWSKMPSNINYKQMCFYPRCLWMSTDATLGAGLHSHSHALSLSLSLRVSVLFTFHIKTHRPQIIIIIEIQDLIVFGCSHFIGSTNTKEVWLKRICRKDVSRSVSVDQIVFDQKAWNFLELHQPKSSLIRRRG